MFVLCDLSLRGMTNRQSIESRAFAFCLGDIVFATCPDVALTRRETMGFCIFALCGVRLRFYFCSRQA